MAAREKFVESIHCSFNARCKACRDPKSDFRMNVSKVADLPDDNVNFDCPYGMSWQGDAPAPRKAVYPATQSETVKPVAPNASKTDTPLQTAKSGCGCKGKTIPMKSTPPKPAKPGQVQAQVHGARPMIFHPEFISQISRDACPDCTRKHLAQAMINLQESINGHPELRWIAIGHIAEAETEIKDLYPTVSYSLNIHWKRMMKDKNFIPDLQIIIASITEQVEKSTPVIPPQV